MSEGDIDVSATLASGRLVYRSPWKARWNDYSLPAFSCTIGVYFLWGSINANSGASLFGIAISLVFISVSAFVAWSNGSSYRIRRIDVPGDPGQVRRLALRAAAALGWAVVREDERSFVCSTRMTGFSWGEYVTIIPEGARLFLNSHTATVGSRRGVSFGKNKKNFEAFRASLGSVQSAGVDDGPIVRYEPELGTGTALGCAVALVPLVGALGAGLLKLIRESAGPPPAPSYLGEPAPTADGRLATFIFIGIFFSFFLSVLVKLAVGLIQRRQPSVISVPQTFVVFAGSSLIAALFMKDGNSVSLLVTAAVAVVLAAVFAAQRRIRARAR